jgi:hypothetical protein
MRTRCSSPEVVAPPASIDERSDLVDIASASHFILLLRATRAPYGRALAPRLAAHRLVPSAAAGVPARSTAAQLIALQGTTGVPALVTTRARQRRSGRERSAARCGE